ncbi:SAM-dependent methyltransferase [Amycolatopsis sp. NPDC051372]|uniref:class I SAM-dependent methyltransferase n=1 Tax=Amycolatopsis sp. NPDC051372 TaxID=3155669 RepID=UPI003448AC12
MSSRLADGSAGDADYGEISFDAAMATFTVHQWPDLAKGLGEVRRVTKGPVVILTCDPDRVRDFWLYEYAPEVLDTEARRYPAIGEIAKYLGDTVVVPVPVPHDCVDGFNEAYFARPEMLLEPAARQACSAWSFVDEAAEERFTRKLTSDLADGTWAAKYGALKEQPAFDGFLVLVISR